jgi:tripartite-type tricarboxylate transporter receptor subunit TctC
LKNRSRIVLHLAAIAAFATSMAPSQAASPADDYPSRPIRLVVTFPPGGGADIIARIIADGLGRQLNRAVIVDNRAGANGNIGMAYVAAAPADGYTIVFTTAGTWAVNPELYKAPFDVVKSFSPIMEVTTSPGVLMVDPKLPVKNVRDLIALAKSEPGKLDYGSAGVGGFGHICGAMFTLMSDTKMTHIPFKGAAPANMAAIAGTIQVVFNDAIAGMPYIQSGQLRALAVTSAKRAPSLPDLPTLDEAGLKGYENSSWTAMAVPAGTPPEIVAKLNRDMTALLKEPDIQKRIAASGASVVGGTPEQFAVFLNSEIAKLTKVVQGAHVTAD